MKLPIASLVLAIASLLSAPAGADVLLLDAIMQEPPNSADGLMRPRRGMTMAQVKARFGEPAKQHPWVGEPPITRWDYPAFSVFFEDEYVLRSVVHRQ